MKQVFLDFQLTIASCSRKTKHRFMLVERFFCTLGFGVSMCFFATVSVPLGICFEIPGVYLA